MTKTRKPIPKTQQQLGVEQNKTNYSVNFYFINELSAFKFLNFTRWINNDHFNSSFHLVKPHNCIALFLY